MLIMTTIVRNVACYIIAYVFSVLNIKQVDVLSSKNQVLCVSETTGNQLLFNVS